MQVHVGNFRHQQRFFNPQAKLRHFTPVYHKPAREKISPGLRKTVLEKNGHRCYCCDQKNNENGKRLEMHHIVPVSFGGKTEEANLLPLCFNCHTSVHRLIDALHINPAKFKRSVLEDVVLRIAQMQEDEKMSRFARMAPQPEGPMGVPAQQPSREDDGKYGLILFLLSMMLTRRQSRMLVKEMRRQAWKESLKAAA